MSNHASDNDDDASHSSESEDEAGNTVGKEHQLPKNNPHSIENDVKIYDARTAVKIKKKPKLLSRAPPPPQGKRIDIHESSSANNQLTPPNQTTMPSCRSSPTSTPTPTAASSTQTTPSRETGA